MASGALKLAAAPLWIYVNDHYYSGVADAYGYSRVGAQVAAQIRNGDFSFHVGRLIGDGATSIITGIIYTVVGSNILGGFFVFAFLGFVSLVLFYRAFRVALPDGDHRRYAKLVFFFPSLLFWTSAIGKDASDLPWARSGRARRCEDPRPSTGRLRAPRDWPLPDGPDPTSRRPDALRSTCCRLPSQQVQDSISAHPAGEAARRGGPRRGRPRPGQVDCALLRAPKPQRGLDSAGAQRERDQHRRRGWNAGL